METSEKNVLLCKEGGPIIKVWVMKRKNFLIKPKERLG